MFIKAILQHSLYLKLRWTVAPSIIKQVACIKDLLKPLVYRPSYNGRKFGILHGWQQTDLADELHKEQQKW
ncbi:hypothetical protein N483_03350 [Pseudoalteromonas luteoviolacea NCIMB 1944]|nr:hypothetical protein N483_03350 [Pseudoalteromonas luteoviolacea NCIMB 1944]